MKKILAMTLALTMTALMFASCGDKSEKSESKAETTTTAAETEAPAEETTPTEDETPAETTPEEDTANEVDNSNWKPLAAIADSLECYDNASLTFAADSDITGIFTTFYEGSDEAKPGDEGYSGDEAKVNFSVQEVAGVPMLKCDEEIYDTEDTANNGHKVLKIKADMNKLFASQPELMDNIFNIKVELVAVAREQAVYDDGLGPVTVAWYGGAMGTNNNGEWNGNTATIEMASDSGEGWCNQWAHTVTSARIGIKENAKFNHEYETNYTTVMAWVVKSDIDLYIADIVFEDDAGNVIKVPEGAIPGGASYEKEELTDADSDGIIEYAEDGTVVLEK
ncbi:hypothetical protein [Ruminococcus albus]|uniref:Lipoprotein n=1 Tax=Ruminococcus albus TaxID=1264 RepID=A0A1I1FV84_RUMAL|nr:hypothetical protein [Ruminococcus albus]SFC03357.1 hypothetical protein SAMN02910406_01031 [Ruminococcus albus]